MNMDEIILKELGTPRGRKKMRDWITNYFKEEKTKDSMINAIMSNTNYFEWLNEFTKDKDTFSDDDWLYFPERIEKTDKENVDKLYLFYEGIDRYAEQNHIQATPCKFGNFYKVRLNESGFKIGVLVGQGVLFFCDKIPVENENEFINFNDIITSKIQNKFEQVNKSLSDLSNMILAIYKNGAPIQLIESTVNDTMQELKSKNKVKKITKNKA